MAEDIHFREPESANHPLTEPEQPPVVADDGSEEAERSNALPFPVVGIGASAGGTEAFIELFSHLPADSGMAYVLIPHLPAGYKSHLVDILSRQTRMPVNEMVQQSRPEPNHVYILPPNIQASLRNGIFILEPRAEGPLRVVDHFFRSLAADQKAHAIGVVLSGTDGDGALGLKAIKGDGGFSIAQSPDTARFPEMPRTSISLDHVDRILPPAQIATELAQLAAQLTQPALHIPEETDYQPGFDQHFSRILIMLRGVSGIDFRLYKPTTLRRRIARRMMLQRVKSLAEYADLLQSDSKELRDLQEDALINVTRFFRDPAVFDFLKHSLLPRMFQDREFGQQFRVWVAGCSTGEEAYSIAICLLEHLTGNPLEPPIQIFGTDASDQNIHRARTGLFPESIAADVSPERLRRFFVKVDRGYQISKRLRDLCIFARQNLYHDPPFSKMDLISCRNVLIYLGAELQKQILPTFHYALRPNGYLLLGTSETIREFTDLFQLVDRKNKFFCKIGNGAPRAITDRRPRLFLPAPAASPAITTENWGDLELLRAADRIVLARYGPSGVIIDEKFNVLQSRGHTAPFLEMPQGTVNLSLPRMLRENIATSVIQAVRNAVENEAPVRLEGLQVIDGDRHREVTLEVLPIHTAAPRVRCYLVLFVPSTASRTGVPELEVGSGEQLNRDEVLDRFRQELASTKLYLQTLVEERDARNQELLSANEEIESANEELQSANEELETTKEELQSSNEELQTINDELQQRNIHLTQTTNDLSNLLNSVNLPVLMLSNELNIRHFAPPAQRLMNLRPLDIGRPIGEIRLNLNVGDLEPIFHEVLETLAPRELEVQDREGHWYVLRVRPYRTSENKIEGLVVVLVDVDQVRRTQQELRETRDFARSIIESVSLPLTVVDREFKVRYSNGAFEKLAGLSKEDMERRFLPDVVSQIEGLDDVLRSHLDQMRDSTDLSRQFEFEHRTPGAAAKVFKVRGRFLQTDGETHVLITIEDITAQKEVERLLNLERERLALEVVSTAEELDRTQDELRALASNLFTTQEEERRRVARELHDDISQRLAGLEIETQQIENQAFTDPAEINRNLQSVRARIASLADDVRSLSHTLHPSVIDDLGIAPAVRSLVEDFREREQMIVTFTVQDLPPEIPPRVATGLYRIAQEALRNIAKHAGKTHVRVVLTGDASSLRLRVMDYGEGFDVQDRSVGLGLISMEERARMLQGKFTIESKPHEGTRITVDVPLSPPGDRMIN